MEQLGLIQYLRKCGSVVLHEQGTLAKDTYEELQRLQKPLKKYMNYSRYGHSYAIEMGDAKEINDNPSFNNQVVVTVTNMSTEEVTRQSFLGKTGNESYIETYREKPMIEGICEFVSSIIGRKDEIPLDTFVKRAEQKRARNLEKSQALSNHKSVPFFAQCGTILRDVFGNMLHKPHNAEKMGNPIVLAK